MKDKKYRDLMITPAFLEARRRKHEHDSSYGRILPVIEEPVDEKIHSDDDRPKSWSHKQDGSNCKDMEGRMNSRQGILSAPVSSKHHRVSITTRGNNSSPGMHFQSWKIPERIVSADIITRNKISKQCAPQIEGKRSSKKTEDKIDKSRKCEQSQKDSPLPTIQTRKKSSALAVEVLQNETQEHAKEWMEKSDKKDKKIAEKFLQAISGETQQVKRVSSSERSQLGRKMSSSSDKTDMTSWSANSWSRSAYGLNSLRNNCIHRTSSVAWRRDSTWLKPTKTFYQTWHGLKTQPLNNNDINFASVYMRPHKKLDPCFIIHPEWGCKA